MANPLQDQLLKLGLVNERQLKKAKAEKRKAARQSPHAAAAGQQDPAQSQAQRAAEKAEQDRQLNLKRQAEREQKAITAQVRQLIEAHRQPRDEGDIAYNFSDGGKIKTLYLSEAVRGRIGRGSLAIVRLGNQYELVPAEIAEKIRGRDPASVVVYNEQNARPAVSDENDPYAAYQVPDDLIW